jgi:hypothetical protein
MADGLAVARDVDPTQAEWTTSPQPVRVVSDSNPYGARGYPSWLGCETASVEAL